MDQLGPSLTKSAKRELRAIAGEFDRCVSHYGALYHHSMKQWSERTGDERISVDQWNLFRDEESVQFSNDGWWEWDGPIVSPRSEFAVGFGYWSGEGSGLESFLELGDSVAIVLSDEGAGIDSWRSWLRLLHEWGIRYELPLLRSDLSLWGCEGYSMEQFDDLCGKWVTSDDGQRLYPKHPIIWRLVHNVFTSSAAALRAIVEPTEVIASNDPWPVETIGDLFEASEISVEVPSVIEAESPNRLVFDGYNWAVYFDGEKEHSGSRFQGYEGFKRLGMILEEPGRFHSYPSLFYLGGSVPDTEHEHDGKGSEDESSQSMRRRGTKANSMADDQMLRDIRNHVSKLERQIKVEENAGRSTLPLEDKLKELRQHQSKYQNSHGSSRTISNADPYEKSRKALSNTISSVKRRLKERMPKLLEHLEKYVTVNDGYIYNPPPSTIRWVVWEKKD